MAITAPIAGAYTGTWNSSALNYTRQGWNLNLTQKGERIEETDLYGLSLIEIVGRGCQMTMDCICKIYGANAIAALWPWTNVFGTVYNAANPIATLASAKAKALVLTVVANTPAAGNPTTLTANSTILSPDQNTQLILNSTVREVPLKFDVLVTDQPTGTGTLFTTT